MRIEPRSLASSVMHSAATVLAFHPRDEQARCTRPGCHNPCVVTQLAQDWQRLAMESNDVRALLTADRWLAAWITQHVNDAGTA